MTTDLSERLARRGAAGVVMLILLASQGSALAESERVIYVPKRAAIEITGENPNIGLSPGDSVGDTVAMAGDVNGDGISDVVVGSCQYNLHDDSEPDFGNDDSGAAWVVFGSRSRLDVDLGNLGNRGFLIQPGFVSSLYQSCEIAGLGDVNGDGLDDILFGAPGADNNGREDSGTAYVVFGKADTDKVDLGDFDTNQQGDAGFRIDGAQAGDMAGAKLDAAGDVNSDGLDDVVVGALFGPGAYVVFGRSDISPVDLRSFDLGVQLGAGYKIDHPEVDNLPMYAVAGAGDVSGDGIPDLVISLKGRVEAKGHVWVVFGHAETVPDDVRAPVEGGFHITSAKKQSDVGLSIDGAGDVNGDGYADLVVGEPRVLPANKYEDARGRVYVIFGSDSGEEIDVTNLGTRGFWLEGRRGMHLGLRVAGVGDTNADGLSDIAAIGRDRTSVRIFVLYGSSSTRRLRVSELGKRGFRVVHSKSLPMVPVDGGADMNGDGRTDLVIGSVLSSQGRGKVFVVWAKP